MTKWMTDVVEKTIEEIIEERKDEIRQAVKDNADRYLDPKRVSGKIKRFGISYRARSMMHYIEKRKSIPFAETLGLNWNVLRVLLVRGYVTWKGSKLVPALHSEVE